MKIFFAKPYVSKYRKNVLVLDLRHTDHLKPLIDFFSVYMLLKGPIDLNYSFSLYILL